MKKGVRERSSFPDFLAEPLCASGFFRLNSLVDLVDGIDEEDEEEKIKHDYVLGEVVKIR